MTNARIAERRRSVMQSHRERQDVALRGHAKAACDNVEYLLDLYGVGPCKTKDDLHFLRAKIEEFLSTDPQSHYGMHCRLEIMKYTLNLISASARFVAEIRSNGLLEIHS